MWENANNQKESFFIAFFRKTVVSRVTKAPSSIINCHASLARFWRIVYYKLYWKSLVRGSFQPQLHRDNSLLFSPAFSSSSVNVIYKSVYTKQDILSMFGHSLSFLSALFRFSLLFLTQHRGLQQAL